MKRAIAYSIDNVEELEQVEREEAEALLANPLRVSTTLPLLDADFEQV